jgi:tripartite-type tricarboxylate transporter receptor subunit TctC
MTLKFERTISIAAWLAGLAFALTGNATAQTFSGKTIIEIINYPAGGPTDIEGRIVAKHLPDHLPGHPGVIVKNMGGAAGLIGANALGEATPNAETFGFFTMETATQILGNPAIHTPLADFVLVAGVESPLVAYMRRDTPPGVNVPADLMKTKDFKALTLNGQNSNTLNLTLALDLLGVSYVPVPAYVGLKEVETAILQNTGQMADTSLSGWIGSAEPALGKLVIPVWQLTARGANGGYPRSANLPSLQTFEEFYVSVKGKPPSADDIRYRALRTMIDPQLAMFRMALLPPKTPASTVAVMRKAFQEMWADRAFLADYARVMKTEPVLISGAEGQILLAEIGTVPKPIKDFLVDYSTRMTSK